MLPLLLAFPTALAGSGPWVPGSGRSTLYLGLDGQRFATLSASGDGSTETIDVAEGVGSLTAVGAISYGIGSRAEVELSVPIQHAWVSRPEAELCGVLGIGACETTTTPGVLSAQLKGLLTDQVSGAPLSLSVGALVRYGGHTAPTRQRLTNAGEGTIDLGPTLAIGRSGAVGQGFYTAHLDLAGVWRTPTTDSYPYLEGDERVPGPEGFATAEIAWAPMAAVAFGPSASFSTRPFGRDFLDLALDDPDRFAALRYAQVRVGGKIVVRGEDGHAVVFGVHRTAWAWNNPNDVLSVSAGISLYDPFRKGGG